MLEFYRKCVHAAADGPFATGFPIPACDADDQVPCLPILVNMEIGQLQSCRVPGEEVNGVS